MTEKLKVVEGLYLNPSPLLWALQEHPGLWNQHTARTEHPESPHREMSDIWVRFAKNEANIAYQDTPHESDWYPPADVLPVKPYVQAIYEAVKGVELGGVLITRQPPGATCYPHVDGGWHARHYEKFALQITSAPGQTFCVEDQFIEPKPGQVFWFDNSYVHWVSNKTPYDRMTLIVALRR
jgi:hypothetical protein